MDSQEYFKKHPVKLSKKDKDKLELHSMIGNLVTQIRYDKGWTQGQLGKKVGLHQPAIARIEGYGYVPSLKTLYKIADKCGYKLKVTLEVKS